MPSNWPTIKLGTSCSKIGSGATPRGGKETYVDEGPVALIRSQNVYNDRFTANGLAYITWDQANALRNVCVQENDVLLNITGDSVARCCIAPADYLPARVNQHVAIIRPDPDIIDPDFLHYVLVSPFQQELMLTFAGSGATRNALTKSMIEGFEIPRPPIGVQRSISTTLRGLDDKIQLLRQTNLTLEAIAEAIFRSWFIDFDPVKAKAEGRDPDAMDASTRSLFPAEFEDAEFGPIPKGWSVERLGDVCKRITKGTTPTTLRRAFVTTGINFIKAESITDSGYFLHEKFAFIDNDTHEALRRSQVQEGDVLVTIATIGRVATVNCDILPANTNQAVAIIRPNSELVTSGFIQRFLQTPETQRRLSERTVQAVQANVSLGSLSELRITIPPAESMMQLYRIIELLDFKIADNIRQTRTLASVRDTLLPQLISGQLRVFDAEMCNEVSE